MFERINGVDVFAENMGRGWGGDSLELRRSWQGVGFDGLEHVFELVFRVEKGHFEPLTDTNFHEYFVHRLHGLSQILLCSFWGLVEVLDSLLGFNIIVVSVVVEEGLVLGADELEALEL